MTTFFQSGTYFLIYNEHVSSVNIFRNMVLALIWTVCSGCSFGLLVQVALHQNRLCTTNYKSHLTKLFWPGLVFATRKIGRGIAVPKHIFGHRKDHLRFSLWPISLQKNSKNFISLVCVRTWCAKIVFWKIGKKTRWCVLRFCANKRPDHVASDRPETTIPLEVLNLEPRAHIEHRGTGLLFLTDSSRSAIFTSNFLFVLYSSMTFCIFNLMLTAQLERVSLMSPMLWSSGNILYKRKSKEQDLRCKLQSLDTEKLHSSAQERQVVFPFLEFSFALSLVACLEILKLIIFLR